MLELRRVNLIQLHHTSCKQCFNYVSGKFDVQLVVNKEVRNSVSCLGWVKDT